MSNLHIYETYGFKFFPCLADKSPAVKWTNPENYISLEKAESLQKTGTMIGAAIPDDVIVIDIDRHEGKPDGAAEFREIKKKYNINFNMLDETFLVRTASNGFHVFFTVDKNHHYTQSGKSTSIDLKTSKGYVIADGSPGYKSLNDLEPIPLPESLSFWLDSCEKIKEPPPSNSKNDGYTTIPVKLLNGILKKINVQDYDSNDKWLKFVMSIIATFGQNKEVAHEVEIWSRRDVRYKNDRSIQDRVLSIEPDGGITLATFIMFLTNEGISQYVINKIKKFQSISNTLIGMEKSEKDLLFCSPDYDELSKMPIMTEFFTTQGNTAAADVLEKALSGVIIYVEAEKYYYYFNGNRWARLVDIYQTIFTILSRVSRIYFQEAAQEDEIKEEFYKIVKSLNSMKWKRDTIGEFQIRAGVFRDFVEWDGTCISETLTTIDGVIEFRDGKIVTRPGYQNEYRRGFVEYNTAEILEAEEPKEYIEFLNDLFPDKDTFLTAKYSTSMCISGNAGRRIFQLWEGAGSNGKSTLVEILQSVLGEKAVTYPSKILLPNVMEKNMGTTPELAKFQGAYAAFGVEVESNKYFSLGLVKQLTGGDRISINPKYQAAFDIEATWQLILAVNDMPAFDSSDQAFLERLIVLPFKMTFCKTKEAVKEKIDSGIEPNLVKLGKDKNKFLRGIIDKKKEIIKYMIDSYIELEKKLNGVIIQSKECLAKKRHYIDDNDDFGEFVKELCVINKNYYSTSQKLTEAYQEFINNHKVSTSKVIKNILSRFPMLERTVVKNENVKSRQSRGLRGICLKADVNEMGFTSIPKDDDEEYIPFND